MSIVTPLPESEAADKVEQTYGRIREMFGSDEVPEPFRYLGRVPAFLQDYYMNFKKFVYTDGKLDSKTKAALALSVAWHAKQPLWVDFFEQRYRELGATDQETADVLAVAAACVTYNVYFKFRDISGSDIFGGMPVGLRAHAFTGTTLDDKTAELINVVLSDLNACKPCTSGHVSKAQKLGVTDEAIHEAIQCAATVHGGCVFLGVAG